MSIEEAWAEHKRCVMAEAWGCRCRPAETASACEHRTEAEQDTQAAARALALAVLEEAMGPTYPGWRGKLRRRIEGLGS